MNILKLIKPSRKEELFIKKETKELLLKLNKRLKNAKAIVGGSFAKNTWLSGTNEVDIFVKFNYIKYKDKNLSKELEKILRNFRKTKLHGSRDYFRIKKSSIDFEIVPVLDIKNYKQALNVMDISPLHFDFVRKNTNKKLQDEIRVTKQFLKANNLYGAESYIKGFSGYLIELLVIKYRSFGNLVRKAANWQDSIVIDIKKHYKNYQETLRNLNWSKHGPLIVIDPVQKNRNVAAALSKEKFEVFKRLSSEYLKKPSDDFFFEKKFELENLKDYLIIEIKPKAGKRDIVGAKLLKLFELIKSKINEEGFNLIDSGWKFNKRTYFWFKVGNENLELTKKHYGPLLSKKMHMKKFMKKWENYKIHMEKDRVYILLERKFSNFRDFLKSLVSSKDIKKNVKYIKVL